MIYLDDHQITDLLEDKESDIINEMEHVFVDFVSGRAKMIPKIYLTNDKGDFRAMPAQWEDISGVKWISVYPDNPKLNIPTIHGTLLLSDTLTGQPIISMDCAKLTSYRTAAVSALAAKHLTINNTVRTLTFIGCGYQAKLHAKMYAATFPNIDTIKLYDRNRDNAYKFSQWLISKSIGNAWKVTNDIRTACSNTDVITTLTPTTEPFLGQSHIEQPFHINAVGADAVGKRELESSIWMNSVLIVDDYEQASHSGEAQYVTKLPYIQLGDIITGKCPKPMGKTTIFDSTGLAIEDIAIGRLIYEEYSKGN